jgi:Flp pilus assembly protein CpaB
MRENKYFYLAVVLALLTGLLTFQFLKMQSKRDHIVVARIPIPQYARIDSSMLELRSVHPESIHPETFKTIQEVVGNFAVVDLIQGEPVLHVRISGNEQYKDFGGELGSEERAIFIPLSVKQNIGGAVSRNDLVDIIYVAFDNQRGFSIAKTILQRVRVLDVRNESGQKLDDDGRASAGGIIVALSAHDSERIAYCLENGQLYITRQPYDGLKVNTEGVFYENIYRD